MLHPLTNASSPLSTGWQRIWHGLLKMLKIKTPKPGKIFEGCTPCSSIDFTWISPIDRWLTHLSQKQKWNFPTSYHFVDDVLIKSSNAHLSRIFQPAMSNFQRHCHSVPVDLLLFLQISEELQFFLQTDMFGWVVTSKTDMKESWVCSNLWGALLWSGPFWAVQMVRP